MRRSRILLAAALIAAGMTVQVHAADRRVPAQYPTIAAALLAAGPGDRVVVAPGIYQEYDLVLPAGITLLGNPNSPASVVIDAGGRGRVMLAESLDRPATIAGVTLTGGRARGDNPYDNSGGGLLVSRSDVRLEDVILAGNRADGSGGGLRVSHGSVVAVRCAMRGNTAVKGGGAVDLSYDSDIGARDGDFTDNAAGWGGAVSVRCGSDLAVFESRFLRNRADGDLGLGGAIACDTDARSGLVRCVLADNDARWGGAVYAADGAEITLTGATVDRNTVTEAGGAFYCADVPLALDHCIVSFHAQPAFVFHGTAQVEAAASDVYGNVGGDWVGALAGQLGERENFRANPLYCESGNHNLRDDSPCAPKNSGIGLVGAVGVGCETRTDGPPAVAAAALGAHPNPFNPVTEVVYSLPVAGQARVSVYDIRGRQIGVLVDESRPAGESRLRWEARDGAGRMLASGTYLLVLETGGQRLTSKLMLVR